MQVAPLPVDSSGQDSALSFLCAAKVYVNPGPSSKAGNGTLAFSGRTEGFFV